MPARHTTQWPAHDHSSSAEGETGTCLEVALGEPADRDLPGEQGRRSSHRSRPGAQLDLPRDGFCRLGRGAEGRTGCKGYLSTCPGDRSCMRSSDVLPFTRCGDGASLVGECRWRVWTPRTRRRRGAFYEL